MSRLLIIKSSRKLVSYILLLVLFPITFGMLALGIMLTYNFFIDHEIIALAGGLMLGLFGLTFLFMAVFGAKRIIIDLEESSMTIVFLGLFRKTFKDLSELKYNNVSFTNQFGSYNGILIQDKVDFQYQLSEFDTRNFKDIRQAVE